MKLVSRLAAAFLLLLLPVLASAQVPSADAKAALGAWQLKFDGPMGPIEFTVTLSDDGGKVAAKIESGEFGAGPVTKIDKAGAGLALDFTIEAAGMTLPTRLTVTPEGDKAKANLDIGPGMFATDGAGAKK